MVCIQRPSEVAHLGADWVVVVGVPKVFYLAFFRHVICDDVRVDDSFQRRLKVDLAVILLQGLLSIDWAKTKLPLLPIVLDIFLYNISDDL